MCIVSALINPYVLCHAIVIILNSTLGIFHNTLGELTRTNDNISYLFVSRENPISHSVAWQLYTSPKHSPRTIKRYCPLVNNLLVELLPHNYRSDQSIVTIVLLTIDSRKGPAMNKIVLITG